MISALNIQIPTEPLDLPPPTSGEVTRGKQDIDAELANSLEKLCLEEREKALFDLHGICPNQNQDPLCQQKWLDTMKQQLGKIKHGTAYELAEKLDFSYVSDHSMLDMFLKSSDCDPYEAAEKIIYFFELKRQIFGVKKLVKDITLDDLDEEDKDYLVKGTIQILPFGDMSGRDILMLQGSRNKGQSLQSEERVTFYVGLESAKRAYHSKTSGVTVVYFGLEAPEREISRHSGLWWSIPNRIAGIHLCTENIEELVRDCYGITLFPAKSLARTRLHIGSYAQCHDSLSAYGIPSHLLPVKCADSPTISHHLEWYKQLEERSKELSMPLPLAAGYNEKDVLFGHKRNHTGNVLMRKLVEMQKEAYDVSPKAGKVKLAREIVEQIHSSGGRFLRRDEEGEWVQVSNDKARDKVAHTFRNLRRSY
eukprot:CAMPEP_0113610128 /NCGR_PEP_ID=MMETSP0017_2-20120614/4860_1 /TAXON_ID=2856 /ORGANISM="Cylindrotheca closterium" /LENGTH=421 /DNA_ID=CAMNT_0000518993 /DNA_START=31 /DNA_END=1296 /DNA_ORIENTATION=- /assembly_acc=CAM_ASM_000147